MFSQAVLAALYLASSTTAHMTMSKPVPFGKSTLNNSPLLATGEDFPCKQRSGVYDAEGAMNIMPLGSSQPLTFTGSATHGGGSCQISITYDTAPTKSSTWKVIHSIEGGCPVKGQAGNIGDDANAPDPDTYSFPVPTTLPTGTATLAWTWFNKVGNREMYMNCAPITITSGSSKRSAEDEELMARNVTALMERDQAAFNALPDMFVANVGNGCGTVDSTDLKFPNPGDSLELLGTATATPISPTGASCPTAGAQPAAASAAAPAASSPAAAAASAPPTTTTAPLVSAGIFATVAASSSMTTSAATAPPAASTPAPVAATTSSVAATSPSEAPTPAATSSSSSSSSSGSSSTAGAMTAGTACSPEGTWNCIGGTSYQRCASGMWSVVQQMAAGTTCSAGQTANIDIVTGQKKKIRVIRFSQEHIRRNAQLGF